VHKQICETAMPGLLFFCGRKDRIVNWTAGQEVRFWANS